MVSSLLLLATVWDSMWGRQRCGKFRQQHSAAPQDPVEELVSSDTVVEIGMEDPAQAPNVLSDCCFSKWAGCSK